MITVRELSHDRLAPRPLQGGDVCESTGDHRNVRTAITCCTTKMEEADGTSSPMAVLVSLQVQ